MHDELKKLIQELDPEIKLLISNYKKALAKNPYYNKIKEKKNISKVYDILNKIAVILHFLD